MVAVNIFGKRVGLRADRAEVLPYLLARFPIKCRRLKAFSVDRSYSVLAEGMGKHILFADSTKITRPVGLERIADEFELDLKFYVADAASKWYFVRAGVVGWQGRAILIPGQCRSGKTTLVRELLRAGADYYSDEYAVFDDKGQVHPFPVRLYVRNQAGQHADKFTAEELGGKTGTQPLPVSLIVLTNYRIGARWRPRSLSVGQALLSVLRNTILTPLRETPALATLSRVVSQAQILHGTRGEAVETVSNILMRS